MALCFCTLFGKHPQEFSQQEIPLLLDCIASCNKKWTGKRWVNDEKHPGKISALFGEVNNDSTRFCYPPRSPDLSPLWLDVANVYFLRESGTYFSVHLVNFRRLQIVI